MQFRSSTTHARDIGGPSTRVLGSADRPTTGSAAYNTKELQISPAADGSVVIDSTEPGATVSVEPTPDGSGVKVTEVLPDGSEGETVTLQPD
jgi:hypothetical protein